MVAEVIVDIAHSDVDKIFDYACGEEIQAGMRVVVPFGRSTATGFVMRIKETSDFPAEKLKRVFRAEEDYPAINRECLMLSEKIAERYRCPKALVLRLFLPAELRTGKASERYRSFVQIAQGVTPVFSASAKAQAALFAYLEEEGETDAAILRDRFGSAVNALIKKGYVTVEKRRVMRDPYSDLKGLSLIHI